MPIGSILLEQPTTESASEAKNLPMVTPQQSPRLPMVTTPVSSILADIEEYGESDPFHTVQATRHNDGSIGMLIPAEVWDKNKDTPEAKFSVKGITAESYSVQADYIPDKEGGRTVITVKPVGYLSENGPQMSISGSTIAAPRERVEGGEHSITISANRKSTSYLPTQENEIYKAVSAIGSATRRLQELELIKQNHALDTEAKRKAATQLHVFDSIDTPQFRGGDDMNNPNETLFAEKMANIRRDIVRASGKVA